MGRIFKSFSAHRCSSKALEMDFDERQLKRNDNTEDFVDQAGGLHEAKNLPPDFPHPICLSTVESEDFFLLRCYLS